MKMPFKVLAAAALITLASSCSTFLDVNANQNQLTSVAPDLILATALTTTAVNYTGGNPSFNSYASWAASYWGKTGGVSGFGEELTYNYSTSFYAGLFDNTYNNLQDYALIQNKGAGAFPNHAAIARIMKAYNFLLLVDEYGDIPYSQALQGITIVTPTYDKAADIYKDLLVQLSGAADDINKAAASPTSKVVGGEDIVFQGNMTKWKQFANSLRLRILLRESQTNDATLNASVAQQLTALQGAADGFITADVVAQPGYAQNAGQQNPLYNRYAYTPTGTAAGERLFQLPTQYVINLYVNNNDPRVSQLYTLGGRYVAGAAVPQYVGAIPGESNSPNFNPLGPNSPVLGSRFLGANSPGVNGGIFKGATAPTILMLQAEHLFSKAEAETRGLFTGGNAAAKTDYLAGVAASFSTFYRAGNAAPTTVAGTTQYNTYLAANATNPLVSFDNASSSGTLGKQAVIIFQKYLAMNSIASTEAWDDYRRTGQPKLPASSQSSSPRTDKLPTRLLYPLSEVSANGTNVPQGVDQYTKIFWDVVD